MKDVTTQEEEKEDGNNQDNTSKLSNVIVTLGSPTGQEFFLNYSLECLKKEFDSGFLIHLPKMELEPA